MLLSGCGVVEKDINDANSVAHSGGNLSDLTYDYVISRNGASNTYSISYKVTNSSNTPIKITFPCMPVDNTYVIQDRNGTTQNVVAQGVLTMMAEVTISSNSSYITDTFTYTKPNADVLSLKNKLSFWYNGQLIQKDAATTF